MTMANDAPNDSGPPNRSSEEAALSARLRRLGDEIDRERPVEVPDRNRPAADASGFALGFRLSSELVAGVLVGAVIGWALDRFLGITPWGLIVFVLLGFAAGVLNVMRAAGIAPERKLDE
jgi:ATP synthase protein I